MEGDLLWPKCLILRSEIYYKFLIFNFFAFILNNYHFKLRKSFSSRKITCIFAIKTTYLTCLLKRSQKEACFLGKIHVYAKKKIIAKKES